MEKTFALINGNVVVNHIIADNSFIEFIRNNYQDIVETTDLIVKPSINWIYENNAFRPKEVASILATPVEETPVV